ncbi:MULTISPECIES: PxKF domain-containing protein [unclassified Microbacterium]|uniref:PxKF domain-containing protein n=1 Tax=unclassified Microbacterium TaxID=2609290 RepID=UPI0012FBA793|nr:PxKF domain-containing protein [Microbacterium sp. MAH-37]MVQ42799.1 hypothetical protein [Microbacterium sp. MAH-37]
MARGWGMIGAALTVIALAAGLLCGPASAATIDWQPGPVTVRVSFDTASATEGIAAGDIEDLVFTRAFCFTPAPVPGEWNGDGVTVVVDAADTEALSCTVRVIVRYCYWVLGRRTCDATRFVALRAAGGPLHVDSANPVVSDAHVTDALPNADGWFRSAGVIHWSGRDDQSGIESCTTAVMVGTDTRRTNVVGLCRDRTGHASETKTYTYKLDATPPALRPVVDDVVGLGAPAGARPGASDETSGIALAVCNGGAPLSTSRSGEHRVVCTAVDAAGNSASATTTYTVGYGVAGSWFGRTEDTPKSTAQQRTRHPVHAGSSVALTFRASTDVTGTPLEHLDPAQVTLRIAPVPCGYGVVPAGAAVGARVPSGLRDLGDGRYQLVWSSPRAWAGSCGLLTLGLGDGLTHRAELAFLR